MKFIKPLIVLFLAAFSFVSCSDDADRVGPAVEITNIPEGKEFKFGENLTMNFVFTDQTGLYEYKYEIYAKDYTSQSFMYENHIEFDGYFTRLEEARTVLLPERSPSETYQEGEYIIKVTAADIMYNVSTYYKTIKIYYPEENTEENRNFN